MVCHQIVALQSLLKELIAIADHHTIAVALYPPEDVATYLFRSRSKVGPAEGLASSPVKINITGKFMP